MRKKTSAAKKLTPFSTSDLFIAAYLLATNRKYIKAERIPPTSETVHIFFENKEACEKLAHKYYSGARVAALLYARCFEEARDILFRVKRGQV